MKALAVQNEFVTSSLMYCTTHHTKHTHVVAVILLLKEGGDKTPLLSYFMISLTYIGAMWTSNLAIQYVNYPMMVCM